MIKGTAIYHTPKGDIEKVHLVADAGKALTNDGENFWNCIDVDSDEGWYEIDKPVEELDEEITLEDAVSEVDRLKSILEQNGIPYEKGSDLNE